MPFKPNYRLQRSIRSNARKTKAEEKLRTKQARSAARSDDHSVAASQLDVAGEDAGLGAEKIEPGKTTPSQE